MINSKISLLKLQPLKKKWNVEFKIKSQLNKYLYKSVNFKNFI